MDREKWNIMYSRGRHYAPAVPAVADKRHCATARKVVRGRVASFTRVSEGQRGASKNAGLHAMPD